jgi:NAD(P)-dependent dehydrogenase (short-subunit alcohol dehydrogenase family)
VSEVGGRLAGQTVVVIGGSSGIGLETARLARADGAEVVLTGRNPERLRAAATELGARDSAAFDATDATQLDEFLAGLPKPIDHVMVTAGGPYYALLADIDPAQVHRNLDEHLLLAVRIAKYAVEGVRPGGSIILMSGTGGRRSAPGLAIISAFTAAMPAMIRSLAIEIAPVRVNLIAPGFVDTPLSATLLGDRLDRRREELRTTLPIRRVVGPEDVGALAVHVMANTALTGATFDIDGGQQLVS